MPAAPPPADAENVTIPPTVQINKMSDKLKAAMEKGSVSAARASENKLNEPPQPPPPPPVPEPPKPIESKPVEAKAIPELKAPEKPVVEKPAEKPAEKTQPDKQQKIPSEQFKILEKSRDEFREKYETAEKRFQELEAKLASQTPLISPEELEVLKKDHALYKGIAEQVGLQYTPQFKAAFTDKIAQLNAEVKDAVGIEHADKVGKILKMPPEMRDEQIEAIGEELSSFKQANLIRAFTELRRVERERDVELSKSSDNISKLEEYQKQTKRDQEARDQQQLESAFNMEMTRASAFPEFQVIEGNQEHNAVVQANRNLAKLMLSPKTAEDKARIAFWASKGVASVQTDAMKDALIAKLQTQLNEMQAANPSVRSTTQTAETKPNQSNPTGLQTVSRYKQAMAEGVPPKE